MRLLLVGPELRVGGAQRHWLALAGALARRGAEVTVLCLAEEGELFEQLAPLGVRGVCAGIGGRRDAGGLRRALSHAHPRPDVVMTRGVSGQLVGAAIAARARCPNLLNEHTPCTADGRLLPLRPHQRVLTRLGAPLVTGVIAVTGRQVAPLAARGFARGRIDVVPNGVFPDELVPRRPRDEVRAALGLDGRELAVLAPAALRPEKRIDDFVRAVAAARRAGAPLRGLVAGDGRERERLEALVAREGAGVALLGARGDVPDLLAAADAVCLPSEAEALPMAVLEAMALGRPVVATDVGGLGDAVVPGVTGALVRPGDLPALTDALVVLERDRQAAARLGEAGRRRQRERFDGETMVDGYVRVLEAAASGAAA